MTRIAKFGLFGVLVLGMVVVYQNCAGVVSPMVSQRRTEDYNQKLLSDLKSLSLGEKMKLCDSPENYSCTERLYAPGASFDRREEERCFATGACVKTQVLHYPTDNALENCKDCTEADRLPGGRYNYSE